MGGILIALGNVGWTLYQQGFRDRARLRMELTHSIRAHPISGEPGPWLLMLDAANVGRRPITISTGGLACPDGKTLVFTAESNPPLPARLEEGQSVSIWVGEEGFFRQAVSEGLVPPTHLVVRDAAGRRHRKAIPKTMRKWLREQMAGGG